MARFNREEIEQALEKMDELRREASRSGDWSIWAQCLAQDVIFLDHTYGRYRGKQAVTDFVVGVHAPFPHVRYERDWTLVDAHRGEVVFQQRMILPEPEGWEGEPFAIDVWSRHVYAGDGLWSEKEDVTLSVRAAGENVANWLAAGGRLAASPHLIEKISCSKWQRFEAGHQLQQLGGENTMTEITKPKYPLTRAGMGIGEGLPLEASDGGVEALRNDIQRLMDLEAIRNVKHAYFRCIDTANWEELQTHLHVNMKTHYMGGGYEFKLSSRDEFVAAMKKAFNSEAIGRHNGYMPEIQILSESEATGIWYLSDHFWWLKPEQLHLTHGTALYWDRYVKEEGRWQILETNYQRIYQINEPLAERPGVTAHYLSEYGTKKE